MEKNLRDKVEMEIEHNISPLIGWLRMDAEKGKADTDGKRIGQWKLRVELATDAIMEHIGEVEYEYAMQLTVQGKVQSIRIWTTKERAQEKLDHHGTGRTAKEDPIYGPWSAKIVKRRKAGKVENA